jgi:hypothetical protein
MHGLIDHLLATMSVEDSAQAEITAAYFRLLRDPLGRSAAKLRQQAMHTLLILQPLKPFAARNRAQLAETRLRHKTPLLWMWAGVFVLAVLPGEVPPGNNQTGLYSAKQPEHCHRPQSVLPGWMQR